MGILLAIFSAFLWSLFDVVRKKAVEKNSALQVIFIIILLSYFFFYDYNNIDYGIDGCEKNNLNSHTF